MLAAQITAPRRVELLEVPAPEPADGQIAVAPRAITLCGSDHSDFIPEMPGTQYPRPLGRGAHEIVGVVVQSRDPAWQEGDRVLALPVGQCGLAERFVCPGSNAVAVGNGRPAEELALAQPLSTLVKAWAKLPDAHGKTVAVVGQGGIGLLYTAMFKHHGAACVIGLDLHDLRLSASAAMGADATITCTTQDPEAEIRRLTEGRMANIVVEAVGHADTVNLAISLAGNGATLLPFGVPREHRFAIDFVQLFRKQVTMAFSFGTDPKRHFPPAVELIQSGAIDVAPMISHRFSWTAAQEAFELVTEKKDQCVRVALLNESS